MPKEKLTNTFVNKVKCPIDKVKVEYFDTVDIGFMLEVRKSGNKTFYYRYNENGITKLKKISDVKLITANKARQIVIKLSLDLKINSNELLNTLKQNSSKPKVITLDEFYTQYYLPHIKQHVKSWKANETVYRKYIKSHFANKELNSINKLDVIKAHNEQISKRRLSPATANKFPIFLSSIFTHAIELNIIPNLISPTKGVKLFKENNHKERFLTPQETQRLIVAVNESSNINLKFIVPFLILTGARKSEVLNAKWIDVDFVN